MSLIDYGISAPADYAVRKVVEQGRPLDANEVIGLAQEIVRLTIELEAKR